MLRTFRECREAAALLRECQSGRSKHTVQEFREGLLEELDRVPMEQRLSINLVNIFEACFDDGPSLVRAIRENRGQGGCTSPIFETVGPMGLENFRNIAGQVMYSVVKEAYNSPVFIADDLFTTVPATTMYTETVPSLTRIGSDNIEALSEGQEYPLVNFGSESVQAPALALKGARLEFTEHTLDELSSFNLLEHAKSLATDLGIEREKTLLRVATGLTNTYVKNNGAAINTYDNNSGTHDWDNLGASTPFVNTAGFSSINTAENLLSAVTDPNTGDPIVLGATRQILCVPELAPTVQAYLGMRGAQWGNTASATVPVIMIDNTASTTATSRGIQLPSVHANQFMVTLGFDTTTWFYGDFKSAFRYRERIPLQLAPMPSNYDDSWKRDVIAGWRVRRFGTPFIYEPRYVAKFTS